MVAEWITLGVVATAAAAEGWHALRVRRVPWLAFGPYRRPRIWTLLAPPLRVTALGAMCWGFLSLWLVVEPRVHDKAKLDDKDLKHLLLVMDVSPSMSLKDAGPELDQTRRARAAAIIESLFNRILLREYQVTLVAVFSEAKPLLKESKDFEVIRHIIEDMPLAHGFEPGKTKLLDGISLAAKLAAGWNPGSATLVVLTDGDTVPPTGMPDLPVSVAHVLVVGIGDPITGRFIDGHQSRQDISTLRQIANRLRGVYHNGNQHHLTSQVIARLSRHTMDESAADWSRREWALAAILAGASIYALLPILLAYFGRAWNPGTKLRAVASPAGA